MDLTEAVYGLIKKASTELPPDVRSSLEAAREKEGGIARQAMDDILKNVEIAARTGVPMCQDTGVLNFFVKNGSYPNASIRDAINTAVDTATEDALLRPNSVDVNGKNIGNVPEIHFGEGSFEISLLLKGGGSENVCTQYKLPDTSLNAGRDMRGVEKCIIDAVFKAQGKGCPPYVVGVCIGGQRDSGYLEAKNQLLRKLGGQKSDFERSITDKLNKLGIGPMGYGGKTTVLDVSLSSLPRHPACYYVSVSLSCWALRRWTLKEKNGKADYS